MSTSEPVERAIRLLEDRINEGRKLLDKTFIYNEDYQRWSEPVLTYLRSFFGEDSDEEEYVFRTRFDPTPPLDKWTGLRWFSYQKSEFGRQINELEKIVNTLKATEEMNEKKLLENIHTGINRIFLVHGHDNAAKFEVARFLLQQGFEVIILHEMPNSGRTIVEKFEDYSDVGFAVVLLTADDRGGSIKTETLQPRARQNVIFELGYFYGKLGRRRVCTLLEEGVEKPSDIDGVVYTSYDQSEGWKLKLSKELKEAGYSVDLNKG